MASFFGRFWGKKNTKQTKRRPRRVLPLAFESLEARSLLSANVDLNLSAIAQQTVEVGQPLQFNLLQAGGTLSVTPADPGVRFQLDPDVGTDTPVGASITPAGDFSWTPAAGQTGLHKITVIAVSPSSPIGLDAETFNILVSDNTPPTATNLSAPETYTEDTPLNLTDIVITDLSASVTATLTLSNPAAGSLNTATSGLATSTYNPQTGIWTATGSVADVNALLAGVTFTPAQDFNSDFSIATSVSDNIAPAITGSKAMTGTPVNDAPTATNLDAPETYTEDTPLNLTDIVISDVDSTNVTATLTLSHPTVGSLNTATSGTVTSTYDAGTGVWSASGAIADVNALLAGLTFTPTQNFDGNFTIATSVSDGVAPAITGSKAMTGTAVNDPPNLILPPPNNAPLTISLGQQIQFTAIVEDPDGPAKTFLLDLDNSGISPTATQPTITSPGGEFSWTPSESGTFTIVISVVDGGQPALADVETLQVTVVVTGAPIATNLSAPETYTEDTPLNLIDIEISDSDSTNVTATLTLSNPAAGSLNTATSGTVTSTYDAGTGAWSASGAIADVNALLAALTFTPAQDFNGSFTIATSVSDGGTPVTGSKAITGTAVNDAPTATNLNAPEAYTVNTPLNLTDIVVSDVDSADVTATLTLSNAAAGSLNTATSGTVTSTYDAGTGIWSASGALADVNALLAGLTFTPAQDFNGNFTIATSVSDGVATPVTGSKAVTATVANEAPTATNLSAPESYTEDTPLDLTDIVVSDADSANVTATLTLSNPAAGSLNTGTSGTVTSTYDAGTGVWSASGALADVNALLAGLIFTPAQDFSGNFTVATSVSDGVASPVTGSKAITGTPVNDAPTATNLDAPETYTEDTPLNLTDIVVSDVDNADVTATLTLSNAAAGSLNTGTSGTVTSTYDAGTGVWSASGALADVNALLAGLTFTPAQDFNGNFTIATSVSDGVAPAVTGSKAVTGTAVNDAPTATNLSAAEIYTVNAPLNLTDIVVSDVDSTDVTATLTLSNAAAGSLNTGTSGTVTSTYDAGTGAWSASGALADVNALLAGLTFTPAQDFNGSFTIATSVSDGVATPVTGSKAMSANVAPTATNLDVAETYTEDTPLDLTDIVVSDADSANVTATLTLSDPAVGSLNTATSGTVTSTYDAGTGVWSASGALADVNALLAGLTFTPAQDFNANFSIATSVSDGLAAPVTGSKAMTGTAVNDGPSATNLNAAEAFTVNQPLNLTDIVVSDVDSTDVTATLTLSNAAAGSLNTATSGTVTSTYDAGTGLWSASGALADVNALLAGLTFTPAQDFNTPFTIATSVSDGVAPAVTGSKAISVNLAPTATNLDAAETYTEDTPLDLTDIVVSDADSANVTATLTLSDPAVGSLNTATSGTVTSTYDAGTGVWSASGALADVNALLAGLTFTPAQDFNANFTIATSVSDGAATPLTGSKAVTGTAVNDAPTATNLDAPETYTEDTPLDLTDIVVSDVDSTDATVTLTLSDPAAGSLNTATSGTVTSTYDAGTGIWSASGALADVNALLAGLIFTPAQDFSGNFTVATSVSDGVASPVTGSKAITGTPVNDAPTATNLNAPETYTEDTPLNLTDIVVSDVDSADVVVTLILSNPAAGSLNTGTSGTVTSTYDAGTGTWSANGPIADVNSLLAGLVFTPALNFNSDFTIATSVSDGSPEITGSKAMTGTPVNDPPNLILPAPFNSPVAITLGQPVQFTAIVEDPDGPDAQRVFQLDLEQSGISPTAAQPTISSPDGQFSWTPTETGTFTIGILVVDGGNPALADFEQLTVTVGAPFAVDDTYNVPIGQTLTTTAIDGVLANDTGATDPVLISPPAHGSVTLNPDGTFSYTQTTYGFDQFTYEVTKAGGQKDQATVTIQVVGLPALPPGAVLTTLPSGLQFYDYTVGTGASPSATDTVTVDYIGYLPNGDIFDSNSNINFALNGLIVGFSEGVQGMKVGGIRRLIIPPDLGYGPGGNPGAGIGGTDTIVFDVTLDAIV